MKPESRAGTRTSWLPLIAAAVGPLLLFGPMLLRGEALFWGAPLLQFTPWRQYAIGTLAGGELPLWNPMLGMGAPLIANYQSALFYPPNWVMLLLGVPVGETLLVLLHLIWAGIGMSVLIRSLDRGPLAQAVGGVAFSLSGYLVARSGFFSINATAAWLPWTILGVRALAGALTRSDARRWPGRQVLPLAGVLTMQWLAGHAQTAWYSLVLAIVWGVWELRSRQIGWKSALAPAGAAFALAFALSALQLLPTAEYLLLSQRAGAVERQLAMTYSFWPWRILDLILPDLFGNPASGDYWGYGNYWEDALYIGVLPILLGLMAGWKALKGRYSATPARTLLILALIVFVLALGDNTPVFPFLYDYVPTFSLFQAPTRWNLILVFTLSLLAALGVGSWREASGRSLYWLRLLTAGSGVIAFAALAGAALLPGIRESFVRAFVIAGFGLFISGGLALILPRLPKRWWQAGVVCFVVVDLVIAGQGLNPGAPVEINSGRSHLVDRVGDGSRIYMNPSVEQQLKFEWAFRFDRFDALMDWEAVRDWGLPNTAILDGIPSANNFDPIQPGRYENWMREIADADSGRRASLLAMMGVGHAAFDLIEGRGPEYERIIGHARARILATAVPVESAEESLKLMLDGELDLTSEGALEGWPDQEPPIGGPGSLQLTSERSNSIELIVEVPEGGWLLLADTWYPGWQAKVDGQPSVVYRMNYLFRGVWLEPGARQVIFTYEPAMFRLGLMFSAVGALILIGLAVLELRR